MSPQRLCRRLLVLSAAAAFALLSSCRPAAKETTPAPGKRPDIAGALDETKVMTFLFGNFDPATKCSVVGNEDPKVGGSQPETGRKQAEEEEPDMLASLVGLYRFPEGSPERVLAMTAVNPKGYDGHGQAPQIGGALFENGPAGWRAVVRNQAITEMGSYGRVPEGKLTKLGPGRYGVEFRPGFSNSGITQEGYSLITESGGTLVEVLGLSSTAEENGGACSEDEGTCYGYTSQVRIEPGANPAWFDVIVHASGTRLGDRRTAEKFSDEAHFVFDGGVYKEEFAKEPRQAK